MAQRLGCLGLTLANMLRLPVQCLSPVGRGNITTTVAWSESSQTTNLQEEPVFPEHAYSNTQSAVEMKFGLGTFAEIQCKAKTKIIKITR